MEGHRAGESRGQATSRITKRWSAWARNAFGALAAVAAVTAVLFYLYRPLPFDATTWKADPSLQDRMASDLINRGILKGLSKDEVEAAIGPPLVRREDHRTSLWEYGLYRRGELFGLGPRYRFLVLFQGDAETQRVVEYGFDD